jgi:biopolymer transport protein ExbD
MNRNSFRRERREADVNIAPLIDMVFILLIFFMVTTTFIKDNKLDIERPGAKTAETSNKRTLRVSIGRREEIYVDGKPVKEWMLQSRIREVHARSRIDSILVVADRRVESGRLVKVVDQCRLSGVGDVAVAVEQEL